jgi:suppressor for copper-sensitivity B
MRKWTLFLFALLTFSAQPACALPQTATYSTALSTSALCAGQNSALAIVLDVAPGFHIQSHTPLDPNLIPFVVSIDPNPNLQFLDPIYPQPVTENFPGLGPQSVFTGRVIVYIPIRVNSSALAGPITLTGKLTWQACNDQACFPPKMNQPFSVQTQIVPATEAVTPASPDLFTHFDASVFSQGAPPAPSAQPAATVVDFFGSTFTLASSDAPLALLVALAVGILFNLMPCVLPVVPLKAIGFLEVSKHNRAKCFFLGLVFSAGVVTCFLILALLIVVLHRFAWGQQFSNPIFVWAITILLLIFAAGMFGLFDIVLPDSVYRVTLTHDSIPGNFIFGIFTAILSTPCTAPMFAGLLAWSVAQPTALGVASIITVGIGMALPYLILSAFPNLVRWIPHTGPWSAVLKQMMGFLLLAAAVYFGAGQLISGSKFIWAVFAVIAIAMLFLIIRTIQLAKKKISILIATLCSAATIALALDITLRLTGGLDWQPFSPQALDQARATGRPVLVEFTANWCGNCLALEASVYRDPRTASYVHDHDVILLRADMTSAPQSLWDVVNHLNPGGGIPLTAIYKPGDQDPIKLTSLYTTQNLIDALNVNWELDSTGPSTQ